MLYLFPSSLAPSGEELMEWKYYSIFINFFSWIYEVKKLNAKGWKKGGTKFWGEFRETKEARPGRRKERQARGKAEVTKSHG